jgi:hypothetical protein
LKLQNGGVNNLKTLKIYFLDFDFLKKHRKIGNECKYIENMFLSFFFIFFQVEINKKKIFKKQTRKNSQKTQKLAFE